MTYKENITAILECYFTGFKKGIIDSACNRILEQEPCEDAISREDALMCMTGEYLADKEYKPEDIISKHIRRLRALPPVQPKLKTGHWIYENYNWRCSECNEAPKTLGYVGTADFMTEHFKFCNHCGAKMNVTPESEE